MSTSCHSIGTDQRFTLPWVCSPRGVARILEVVSSWNLPASEYHPSLESRNRADSPPTRGQPPKGGACSARPRGRASSGSETRGQSSEVGQAGSWTSEPRKRPDHLPHPRRHERPVPPRRRGDRARLQGGALPPCAHGLSPSAHGALHPVPRGQRRRRDERGHERSGAERSHRRRGVGLEARHREDRGAAEAPGRRRPDRRRDRLDRPRLVPRRVCDLRLRTARGALRGRHEDRLQPGPRPRREVSSAAPPCYHPPR